MQMQIVQKKTQKFFDNTFENIEKNVTQQGKSTLQQLGSQFTGKTSSQNGAALSTVASQFTGHAPTDKGANETGNAAQQLGIQPHDEASEAATKEMVQDLYEPSDPDAAQQLIQNHHLPKAGEMNPEEQAMYQKLKKELHDQVYYTALIQRKSAEQEHVEEEHVDAQEQQMEELQVQEKQKKDDDIALRMATNKAEQFPGVAG